MEHRFHHVIYVYMYFEFVILLLRMQCHFYCSCDYCAVDCSV